MTALSTKLGAPRRICPGESPVNGQLRAGATYTVRPGSLLIRRDESTLLEPPLSASPRSDAVVVGVHDAQSQIDGTTNADGGGGALDVNDRPILLSARTGAIGYFDTGAAGNQITYAHLGRPCFAYDDNTLYLTDNSGTLPFAGLVGDVDENGKVMLLNTAAIRAMRALFVEGGAAVPGITKDSKARAVVTSLAANTVTLGVMTADANGAIAAQDGVTLAVGDEIYIPEGTTNLDNDYEAGPYTVISLGSVSTPFVLARPSTYADGSVITQNTDVQIAEGTIYGGCTFRTFASSGAIVGTDAPLASPDYVSQSVSLGGGAPTGTVTISNVPVRSATDTTVTINRTTAVTASLTVQYNPSAVTAGALGTASVVVEAQVAAGTINAADGSTLTVGVRNW